MAVDRYLSKKVPTSNVILIAIQYYYLPAVE